MAPRVYATVGRAGDNDVVLEDPTVSNHHARLSWSSGSLMVEDLSSVNGTFVDGERVKAARIRPGVDLHIGHVPLPWSHEGLRTLLKAGAGSRTLVMPKGVAPTYLCGACGHIGKLPSGPIPEKLTCTSCGATLRTGTKPKANKTGSAWKLVPLLGIAAAGVTFFLVHGAPTQLPVPTSVAEIKQVISTAKSEEHIGGETAKELAAALTPMDPVTRNAAVKIAARTQGPFHVEQVAEIWNAVRQNWRYVNDPEGREYFATATETIENGYVGDCDDFAIALTSMVTAIGGKARIVLMDGPRGGHAYAEACVQGEPTKVASTLRTYYRNRWKKYLSGPVPNEIAYRTSEACPIWLNLDWNSNVPGGAYEPEGWAVAIYEDGHSEMLAAANPAEATKDGKVAAPPASANQPAK